MIVNPDLVDVCTS